VKVREERERESGKVEVGCYVGRGQEESDLHYLWFTELASVQITSDARLRKPERHTFLPEEKEVVEDIYSPEAHDHEVGLVSSPVL